MRPLTVRRLLWTCGLLALVLLACVVLALKLGAVPISVTDLVWNLGRVALGRSDQLPTEYRLIVFDLRLPRILLGILVGASLSVAGASFQAMLRNPLADPYILGVSSGAAVGAIVAILTGLSALSLGIPLASSVGALLTILTVFYFGRQEGKIHPNTLLLAGVITSSFLSAIIMFFLSVSQREELHTILFWLMGDFSLANEEALRVTFPYLIFGFALLYFQSRQLNLILLGEENAVQLGVNVERVKWISYFLASLMTAASVSVCGLIGFVGLIVPHSVRLLFGPDHRLLLPASALLGASFLIASDTIARTLLTPVELPVGVVTAVFGGPFFIYLLRTRKVVKTL